MEGIARDYFLASFPWHPAQISRILQVRKKLKLLYREKRRDPSFDYIVEMFRVFNENIVNGLPSEFVFKCIERYARHDNTVKKIDPRLMRIVESCHRAGKITGILSAGFIFNIRSTLHAIGKENLFNSIEANILQEHEGKAV